MSTGASTISSTVSTLTPVIPITPTPTAPPSTTPSSQSGDLNLQIVHLQALMTSLEGVPSVPTQSSTRLVPATTPQSDAPPQQTMESEARPGQEASCLNECCDWCCREVCTLENCCCLCVCACKIICCVIRARLGVREIEEGRREHNPFRVAAGVGTLTGNGAATAFTFFDQLS